LADEQVLDGRFRLW